MSEAQVASTYPSISLGSMHSTSFTNANMVNNIQPSKVYGGIEKGPPFGWPFFYILLLSRRFNTVAALVDLLEQQAVRLLEYL